MAVRIPLKWVLVGLLVTTTVVPVNCDDTLTNCDWLTASSSECIKYIDCQDSGVVVRVWEDCEKGEELFTITNTSITLDDACLYGNGKSTISLSEKLDAEDIADTKSCTLSGTALRLFFEAADINEYPPSPSGSTLSVMEVNIMENTEAHTIEEIYYSDEDYGEAETLSSVLISTEYKDVFSLEEGTVWEKNNTKTFIFKTKKELNYEERPFYKVEYNITSKDEKDNTNSVIHTFFVYIGDAPDMEPFWTDIVPFYELEECKEEDELFKVTAQDRDVMVDYDIKYSFVEESEYFEIDDNTGWVKRKKPIDREELLEDNISSFSLAIKATEYKDTGEPGEWPNSNEQVSIVSIQDCNDETPEFNNKTYEIEMDELTKDSGNQVLDLSIVVKDMDEGEGGTFSLETDHPDVIEISPSEGKQNQEVTLTAIYKTDNTLFDYEHQQNNPFTITLTATETMNTSHTSSSTVTIVLRDVNDAAPAFLKDIYSEDVEEGTNQNAFILMVEANDADVSPEYGKPSIRYILESSCNDFQIDSVTGNVTLKSELNYEDKPDDSEYVIKCKVTARDENGTTNEDTAEISVTVIDVVDEPPRFETPINQMEIMENSEEDTVVGTFTVTDADADASISFEILKSSCSDVTVPTDVNGWFTVKPKSKTPPSFPGKILVVSKDIDREACKEVTLTIQAEDENTDEEYQSESSATETFTITILDENDEPPFLECESDCKDISVNEVSSIQPDGTSVLVFKVTVTDPDEEDVIHLSISEGGDLLYLSKENVSVQAGNKETVEVWTIEDADIDREKQDTIEVKILSTDSENHSKTLDVSVKVNDLNDNKPVIDATLCGGEPIKIEEDDGRGRVNGTIIISITATDADEESPNNIVKYMLLNEATPDSQNVLMPFTIDKETGNVTVLLTDSKKLDREQFSHWELLFMAYDCDTPICKSLESDVCLVSITVLDVNDNAPRDLTWAPDGLITVGDFQKKDEELPYLLTAVDDDEGENSTLTYSVLGTYLPGSDIDKDLFYAEEDPSTMNRSCRLYANKNFQGMGYTGEYNVVLQAMDGGNKSTPFNISVSIEDENDKVPYFVFDGCLGESENNTITMEENAYTPGDNERMEVKCFGPDGAPFIIRVEDKDIENKNKIVKVKIDMENSTVEDVGDDVTEQTLLSYWSLEPEDCEATCRLKISHLINREEGTAYNLSLHVRNIAEPQLESWALVRVVVTNKMEFPPYFCKSPPCSQIVYMYENEPDVSAEFKQAIDEDNNGVSLGDDDYDKVYYYIVGGDKDYFKTVDDFQEKIVLKDMPYGLDREEKEEYLLKIRGTNEAGDDDEIIDDSPRNDTLDLIIRVGDVNDNDPVFSDDVIFSSFMATDSKDDHISIIKAIDEDLNETLTYKMLDDLQWFETDVTPDTSFRTEWKDNRSVYLTLDFDPKSMTRGYCNFTIHVTDLEDHTDETVVKVYVINDDYQVSMYFSNEVEEVDNMSNQIENIYTRIYNYECSIDSIAPTQSTTGETIANMTTVYMHFLDEEKNEPVDDKIILDLSDNGELMYELAQQLSLIGINLYSVDQYTQPSSVKDPEETIRELQILLGVVSLVLGLLVILLATIYWLRTNKLQRKVKVLSTNTFGSKEEDLHQMGLEMASVPGSNYLAKEHGNHNPVFSENGVLEMKSEDTGSISSGDSVLVGVEDNPEFKSYSAKGTPASSSRGFENSSYGRSIDDVSAAPPGLQGGMKGNPLLNLGGLKDKPEPSAFSNQTIYDADSLGSQDDTASVNPNINSNFSFS